MLIRQLIKSGRAVAYIESPLLPSAHPYVTLSVAQGDRVEIIKKYRFVSTYAPISRVHEVLLTLFLPIFYNFRSARCITSDPLTTLPAVILRKIGFFKYVYYHCIDYSKKRFKNKLINAIYRTLLYVGLHRADLVGCVTKKTMETVRETGAEKLFYIPNSLSVEEFSKHYRPVNARDKYSMALTCAGVSEQYRVLDLVKLTDRLSKVYPSIKLIVIGSKEFERKEYDQIQNYINVNRLNAFVIFTGQLSRDDSIKAVAKCWIGLAFYNKNYSHVNFGDSLKIREYAALGVPIVSDRTTPTSIEMEDLGAGVVVNEPWDAFDSIAKLFDDPVFYESLSQKALAWAKSVDKSAIVDNLIKNYLEKQ